MCDCFICLSYLFIYICYYLRLVCYQINQINSFVDSLGKKARGITEMITRMHSSRMRTGRSLTVCQSLLLWGVGGLFWGGICSWGVSALGRGFVCSGGCLLWGGVCPWGVWYPNMHWGRHPPVDRITDACKNITLATTSLRPVKI